MTATQKFAPCLWFDHEAEEAAAFTSRSFPVRASAISRAMARLAGKPGSVLTVGFELGGARYLALNGGPSSIHRGDFSRRRLRRSGGGGPPVGAARRGRRL